MEFIVSDALYDNNNTTADYEQQADSVVSNRKAMEKWLRCNDCQET